MGKSNTEQRIIETAKSVFIEKGYAETSMSDIAAKAGINRPALHYYFRTKDKMFEAVFADLVLSFIPSIQEVIFCDAPLEERIAKVTDIYFDTMLSNPSLPMFAVREVQRDAAHMVATAKKLETGVYMEKIRDHLLWEMEQGRIKPIPVSHIFYTFYGLLFTPFISRPITEMAFSPSEFAFSERIQEWKHQVVKLMVQLLSNDSNAV